VTSDSGSKADGPAADGQAEDAVDDEPHGEITLTPARPYTLAIDIGGTGLKASVLDMTGAMVAKRVRVATHYPMPPAGYGGMVLTLKRLVEPLPEADRVSAGFPGMVREGHILSAPHFVTTKGPGSPVDPELVDEWSHFDMAGALSHALGKPTRVANDADVQGLAAIVGKGLEMVITLGTGFGTAVFIDGTMLPHLELAHQQFRKGETFNEQLGEATRKVIGETRWNRRVRKAIDVLDSLVFFDHLYIGGGNARRVIRHELGDVLARTTIVDNTAGILGGIKLWEGQHLGI
jgi:polyphosphate glucokinase